MVPSERLDALKEIVNDHLQAHGYAVVEVEAENLDALYGDYGDGTIKLHAGHVAGADPTKVLETALHEAAHAMRDQDGGEELLTEEELRTFNEPVGWEGHMNEDGELEIQNVYNPFHEDIYRYAEEALRQWLAECTSEDRPVESTSRGDVDFNIFWNEAIITDEPSGFEFLWDEAVIVPNG